MTISYERLRDWSFPEVEQRYGVRDTILYALSLGMGSDPVDSRHLRFVYEPGLHALPTMGVVLASPGPWLRDPRTGVDYAKVLHGEQAIEIERPLQPAGIVIGRTAIEGIVDKGPGANALIYTRREVIDKESGERLCKVSSTTVCRGEGGFGGPSGPMKPSDSIPERAPDLIWDQPTLPQAALIYRLLGDLNPLHSDPGVARAAGFSRPILHGLCTFGIAGLALLLRLCDLDPRRFKSMRARFSAAVFPGDLIRTEIWQQDVGRAAFRCRVPDRAAIVLDNGHAEYMA